LGDPLLVREGRGLVPTPRAEALAPALEGLLRELRRVLVDVSAFDPATSERTFVVAAPDVLAPLVPDLLEAVSDAPRVTVELRVGQLSGVPPEVDLAIGVMPSEAPGVIARRLGQVHQAVALRAGHPALELPWTPATYASFPHVTIRTNTPGPSLVEQALEGAGLHRRVGLVAPTFLLAPHVVARTDLLFTGPKELLELLAPTVGLVVRDPPVPMPAVPVAAQWTERVDADPGHRWLRRRVIDAVAARLA
ncbi:MAG: hypothetical protein KC621_32820, partial [Myxococcales bacterium]|nr:hypothetical protein [Myxococcales bacterium]